MKLRKTVLLSLQREGAGTTILCTMKISIIALSRSFLWSCAMHAVENSLRRPRIQENTILSTAGVIIAGFTPIYLRTAAFHNRIALN